MTDADPSDEGYVEELERYRRRLEGAMYAGDLAWWEMDVETGAVEFHENKATMLDLSTDDFDHYEDFTERLHPDDHERAMEAMRAHLEGRAEKYDVEYRIRRADGDYRWFRDVGGVTERTDDGRPAKVTGVVADVTHRKEMEERLRERNEQLTLLNRIVRHDIRNDVQVIAGWADVLAGEVTPPARDHIDRIVRASEHARELTENVRDLVAVLEHDDGGIDLRPVDLVRIVRDEVERVEETTDGVEIRVETDAPSVEVQATGLLSSVVSNLLTNAVQHADGVRIDVDVQSGREAVVLRVADDGPGVPPDRREAVFRRGERGIDSEGTGVGLYLVATLVEAFGGTVRIEDSDMGGAAFVVELVPADGD